MKASFFRKFTFGASLLLLPLLGGCTPQASSPPSPTVNAPATSNTITAAPDLAVPPTEIASAAESMPADPPTPPPPDPGTVSVTPDEATTASVLPPYIYPTSPLAQVINLSQAGVDESIIMTFIANSGGTFNLNSDKIIYLKDIGLPSEVVTAMMQRDQQLLQQLAAASQPASQPAPTETTPETAPAPPPPEPAAAPPTQVTINNFYDTLAPYGSWISVDGYGRCWRPSVVVYNPGWQPYCDHGRWIYTDRGWYWSSDYSWGWAPFHYGRWFRHSNWGWCWTPDTVWGPSWVTWRYSSGYCGWAPLPPYATYRAGMGFYYRGGSVGIGFNWGLSENCFTFVPTQFFCDPYPRRRSLAPHQVTQIFNQTTVVNNYNVRDHDHGFVNHGIDPEHISAVTHTPIHPVALQTTTTPSGHGPRGDRLSQDGSTLIVSHPPRPNDNRSTTPPHPTRQTPVPVVTTHGPQDGGTIRVPPPRDDSRSTPPTHPVRQSQVPVVTTHGPQDGGVIRVPPPQNDNRSAMPVRPVRQPQAPVVTTPAPPAGGTIRVPPQYPAPSANYNPPPAPNNGNRTYSPRQREQIQSSGAPRSNPNNSGAPGFTPPSRSGPPAVAPVQPQPQPRQPSSPPPASSAPRSSGQNQNQNSFGNNPGNWSGNGPGPGAGPGPGR